MTAADYIAKDPSFFSSDVWRATWRMAVAYWLLFLVLNSVLWGMAGVSPIDSFVGKLFLISFCALATLGMTLILYRCRRLTFTNRALLCIGMAVAATPVFCLVDHVIHTVSVYPEPVPLDPVYLGYSVIEGIALFFGWSCLSVALLYSADVRDRERQLAAAREEALAAQMRALRYQVNPHFLFNTLNSVTGLIEEGASERASRMVMSLSAFLRTTLTLDPVQDVRLVDELALQEKYLLIERERFNDRMTLTLDVEDGMDDALLPSLILQPLVENAMKHGIGATAGRVELAVRVSRREDRLLISIENDMPAQPSNRALGTGIGLRNVEQRLKARFGDQARSAFGLSRPGRFRAFIDIPFETA